MHGGREGEVDGEERRGEKKQKKVREEGEEMTLNGYPLGVLSACVGVE